MKQFVYSFTIYTIFILFGFFNESCFAQSCDSNLVASYTFDGNANDVTEHGYNLNVHGATLTNDRFGNSLSAYSVDPSNAYLDIITNAFPKLNQIFTYSIWFSPTGGIGPIWMYGNNPDTCISSYSLRVTPTMMGSTSTVDVNVGCLDSIEIDAFHSGIVGWHQATIVNNGIQIKSYRYGVLASVIDTTFSPLAQTIFSLGRATAINQFGFFWGFRGSIDDLKIYNCAMTDSEVFHHYTSEHLGISVQTQDQIKIGPSPTNDIFSISAGVRWLNANVDIYNMEERLLFSTVMNKSNLDISMQKF